VFVIRRQFEDAFRERIGTKLDGAVETEYVFQELDSCIGDFTVPEEREKPWGTGHAILMAKDVVHEPFAVINADDYYGVQAYRLMADQLMQTTANTPDEYAMVGYVLRNTLSDHGSVARGVCRHNDQMCLTEINERTSICKKGQGAVYTDEQGNERPLTGEEIVSMNMWGFAPDIFDYLRQHFEVFLEERGRELKSELYIPFVVDDLVQKGLKRVKILKTPDSWFGVTYKEDKESAQRCVQQLIDQGVYPAGLWDKP
jgi:UTP-glucose-1-phosphate uridylyltransferase